MHRVAIGYNKILRSKRLEKSVLDDIKGIGNAKKKALLTKFKSIEKIQKADIKELCEVKGITEELAKKIKNIL